MIKQMEIPPWEKARNITCQYCGKELEKKVKDYCSDDCRKSDSIWHRV